MSGSKITDKVFGLESNTMPYTTLAMLWWKDITRNIRDDMRRRRDMRHLEAMSDHELRDIGLDRGDIAMMSRRRRKAFPPPRV